MPQLGIANNPGMCPYRELNQQPFALQDDIQSTELRQSGLGKYIFKHILLNLESWNIENLGDIFLG